MSSSRERKFIQIVRDNSGIINSLCRVYFKMEMDFEDARQDVILQLWKAFPSFRKQSSTTTWVYRICLNTLLNKKRTKSNINVDLALVENTLMQTKNLYSPDDIDILYALLEKLSDRDKALTLLYLEGFKYREIGSILSISLTSVTTRMNRIKNRLSKLNRQLNHEN